VTQKNNVSSSVLNIAVSIFNSWRIIGYHWIISDDLRWMISLVSFRWFNRMKAGWRLVSSPFPMRSGKPEYQSGDHWVHWVLSHGEPLGATSWVSQPLNIIWFYFIIYYYYLLLFIIYIYIPVITYLYIEYLLYLSEHFFGAYAKSNTSNEKIWKESLHKRSFHGMRYAPGLCWICFRL